MTKETTVEVDTPLTDTVSPPSRHKVSCRLESRTRALVVPLGSMGPSTVGPSKGVDTLNGHGRRQSAVPSVRPSRRQRLPPLPSFFERSVADEDDL